MPTATVWMPAWIATTPIRPSSREQPERCDNGLDDDCDPLTLDLFDGDADGSDCSVDCNDADATVSPGATELCANGIDDDCSALSPDLFDADGDGSSCSVDCDDGDANIFPNAIETLCNLVDDDCDPLGTPDDPDADGDLVSFCTGDCVDSDPNVNPGAVEICNNLVDDNCDNQPDCLDAELCHGPGLHQLRR